MNKEPWAEKSTNNSCSSSIPIHKPKNYLLKENRSNQDKGKAKEKAIENLLLNNKENPTILLNKWRHKENQITSKITRLMKDPDTQ